MKQISFIVVALILALLSTSASVEADSGQIVVYRPIKKKDDQSQNQQRIEKMKEQIENPIVDSKPNFPGDGKAELSEPTPVPFDETDLETNSDETGADNFFVEGRSFEEPNQRAVIFWNGEEEILTLTTVQKSLLRSEGSVLSVFPLPGELIDVYRGDEKLFGNCYRLIMSKCHSRAPATILKREIGSHSIVAFKIDEEEDLYASLDAYVEKEFGKGASVHLSEKHRKVLLHYARSGFHYFVFDLQTSKPGQQRHKEALTYRFKTSKLFYPLVISRLGGSGSTVVNLVVVTPKELENFSGIQKNKRSSNSPGAPVPNYLVTQTTPRRLTFTQSEIRKLSSDASDLLRDYEECFAQLWVITGQMDGFQSDLFVSE